MPAFAPQGPLFRAWRSLAARVDAKRWSAQDETRRKLLSRFVPQGGLCFDVGANMGNRVKCLVRAGARVVAVEPQEHCLKVLHAAWGRNPNVTIIAAALGATEGVGTLHVGDSDTISSMSETWIQRVSDTRRFGSHRWRKSREVRVDTLDALVRRFGTPDFIKIDVEGFEDQVVAGLSSPVNAVSLEFTPEYLDPIEKAIRHLASLGQVDLNVSFGESAQLAYDEWHSVQSMLAILNDLRNDHQLFGDVYLRFVAPA